MDHLEIVGLLFIIFLALGLLAAMQSNQSDTQSAAAEHSPTPAEEKEGIQELLADANQSPEKVENPQLPDCSTPEQSEPGATLANETMSSEANENLFESETIDKTAGESFTQVMANAQTDAQENPEGDAEENAAIDQTPIPALTTESLSEITTDTEPIVPLETEIAARETARETVTEAAIDSESLILAPTLATDSSDALPTDAAVAETEATGVAIADRNHFNLETFKQAFVDTLLQVQGQSLQTATIQDCYATLAAMVQQRLRQLHHPETDLTQPGVRIIGEIAPAFYIASPLESRLINLGIAQAVEQGLQQLGFNLHTLLDLETAGWGEPDLATVMGGYLESLSTARLPAIGYGIRNKTDRATQAHWETQRTEAGVFVKFGGATQVYTGTEGRLRVRWIPQKVVQGIPFDTLIPGYGTDTVSLLRRWQPASADLNQPESIAQTEEQRLKQQFFLASCAIQDVIWLHERTGAPIETLPERFALQLNDTATALAIAELMHWLVDEYGLEWQQSWTITQKTFSCTLHSLMPDVLADRWSIPVFSRLLPRHLEIIYEINRRFLAGVSDAKDTEQIQRLSLIDESGNRSLRVDQLACLGSYAVRGVSTLHNSLLQRAGLADLVELYPGRFGNLINGINPRHYLLQSNPHLANLLTQWLGQDWITQPQALKPLEELAENPQFCAHWWEMKRSNKQEVANAVRQQVGIAININSLFDIQAVPIAVNQRQLLNLLHVITLYGRLKVNATTDTIQHFTHRSVPRTCFFVGQVVDADPIALSIAQLMQAVATTINNDADVQGKLQVIVLEHDRLPWVRQLYGAADLVEHLPLAAQVVPSLAPYPFALNGAMTLGSFDHSNLELQVDVKHGFLFGMNAAEVSQLQAKGYDPSLYYSTDPDLQQAISPIASGYFSFGDTHAFKHLGNWLLTQDPSLVLAEYQAYLDCQERVSQTYQDQKNWTRLSILTTARMSKFSSDRTIQDYQHLWQIAPLT